MTIRNLCSSLKVTTAFSKTCRIKSFAFTFAIVLSFALVSSAFAFTQGDPFTDTTETDKELFLPYITTLSDNLFVTGDMENNVLTGEFRPTDPVNRAEFTKIMVINRLAENYGIENNWQDMVGVELEIELMKHLINYLECPFSSCFSDVEEISPNDKCVNEVRCIPWYTQYVHYALYKGFIRKHNTFDPKINIPRIHAIKMLVVDNGEIEPEQDSRYNRLMNLTESRNSTYPKCISSAKDKILEKNNMKLYKYAVLADRLDFFGNECQLLKSSNGIMMSPAGIANFLQSSVTRQETVRYIALSSSYSPISINPATDETVNTAEQNKGTDADKDYIPPDKGGSSGNNNDDNEENGSNDGQNGETESNPSEDGGWNENEDEDGESEDYTSANHDIECIYDVQYNQSITIKAGQHFETGKIIYNGTVPYQRIYYNDYKCDLSCSELNTPECRAENRKKAEEKERKRKTIYDVLNQYVLDGNSAKETCNIALKATVGNAIYHEAVKKWCSENVKSEEVIPSINVDYWYAVIPWWNTVKDNNWGGVFSKKIYDSKYRIDKLFPVKKGNKYRELIVQVVSSAEEYDNSDTNIDANKKIMIKNYRTTRWYKIKYINPSNLDAGEKEGWVPVSGLVLKDDMFKITIGGLYIYDYYNIIHNRGYTNTNESNISKILFHNTAGSTASSLIKGINSPPHYYFGREHKYDINAGMDNRFTGYIPEYLNSGTVNSTGSGIEKKSISIEMVNWSWLNPSLNTIDKRDREVISGNFYHFDFDKLKKFTEISGKNYDVINNYFNDNNGFFEILTQNYNDLTANGKKWRNDIKNRKEVFEKFYINDFDSITSNPIYILDNYYINIIDSGYDPEHKLDELYEILNKIPFEYSFKNYLGNNIDISHVMTPAGTYPFEVYTMANVSRAQALTDGRISSYYEKYTNEQYKNLNKFIDYMNEKYGMSKSTFKYNLPNGIPQKYGFYMYDTSISWDSLKNKVLSSNEGVISHRNSQKGGKMCPSPGFQIDRLNILNN